ncbi:RNA-binding domain-containing protein [Pseudoxanthomonas mexicana]|uniref:RNA-binding domain-containing protein n=1 Tax=Pseudoxanthomonas mexicana TaxID=128785 RepID=UPI00398B4EA9
MSIGTQQLDLFDDLSYYEGADVEYKSGRGGLPSSLWETYSAFANTAGGTLWLGISQGSDGQLRFQGLENPEKLKGDIHNLLNNREKVSRNLLTDVDVEIVRVPDDGRALIRIRVPQAGRRERPVYVGKDPFNGTYRRDYEGDYRCTEDEVRRMFADQSEEPVDSRILEGFGMEDIHPQSLAQFRNRFASLDPSNPWLAEDDRGLLEKLGGWRRDRRSGKEGVTLAGLLMFGREAAIRDPAAVPGFHLDYREHFSDDPAIRWTDRLTPDGHWEANLFQFYQRVIVKLGVGPGIKQPFQLDAEGYRRATTSVHEALQEALVNALIHADHSGQGGIVIDRYFDHLEFSNPGTLLLSREQLSTGGISECRNKSLQLMFQKLGAGDKAGSGLDRIRSSWSAQHWQSPRLLQTWRPDRVQLRLPMISTLPEVAMEALRERFGSTLDGCSADEIQALVAAEVEGEVSNQRLQEMLSLHRVDITRMLKDLVQKRFLTAANKGRWTRYSLVEPESGKVGATGVPRDSGSMTPDSASSPPDSGASPPDSASSPPDSGSSPPDSEHLDPAQDPKLLGIAGPVRRGGAAPRQVVLRTILALCEGRFLRLRDLSQLLNRRQETLRDSYVRDMVRDGLLEQRFPGTPSHKDQAYRTKAETLGDAR